MKRIIILVLMVLLLITCTGFSSRFVFFDGDEDEERPNKVVNITNP